MLITQPRSDVNLLAQRSGTYLAVHTLTLFKIGQVPAFPALAPSSTLCSSSKMGVENAPSQDADLPMPHPLHFFLVRPLLTPEGVSFLTPRTLHELLPFCVSSQSFILF